MPTAWPPKNADAYWDFADQVHCQQGAMWIMKKLRPARLRCPRQRDGGSARAEAQTLTEAKLQACVKAAGNEDSVRASMKRRRIDLGGKCHTYALHQRSEDRWRGFR